MQDLISIAGVWDINTGVFPRFIVKRWEVSNFWFVLFAVHFLPLLFYSYARKNEMKCHALHLIETTTFGLSQQPTADLEALVQKLLAALHQAQIDLLR